MLNFETCCVKLEFRVRSSEFRAVADRKLKDFKSHLGSCQNYGPFLGTLNIRCRIIIRTQKGTIILTTTHIGRDQNFQEVAEGALCIFLLGFGVD